MKTIQKAITAITLAAVLICMTANIKAKAEIAEAAEIISDFVTGADLTSIAHAYNNLTTQQKFIADYLMGAFNYTYLCARGFSFNIDQTETNMKAQLGAIGERIWQFVTTAYGWKSRFNEVFRQYASSIIVYAAKINVSFDVWIDDILSGNRTVYIEYSENAFDAWTEFYNDPSGDGIASFGLIESVWDSGDFYDYAFVGIPYDNSSSQTRYNNFVLNYNPIMYTNSGTISGNLKYQRIVSIDNIPNTLFILRGDSYQSYRYGFDDFTFGSITVDYLELTLNTDTNIVNVSDQARERYRTGMPIRTSATAMNLSSIVETAFSDTPFVWQKTSVLTLKLQNWYPFVQHVYLVDNLETLSNPEEIFNTQDFDIVAPGIADFIITPNGKMLIPGYAPIEDPFADLWEVSVDVNGDTVTEDDFETQIVNNTVINNYIVDSSDKINVPVDWFDNELSDQLANDSIPFLSFARDCIDCLGDLQMYFYGAIVFGLGGGVLKKLLL